MKETPPARVIPARSFSLIWIVPIVAFITGGWLIYRDLRNSGPEIVIDFEQGTGIEAGKTSLVYKGVVVGMVNAVQLKPNLEGVTVTLELAKSAAPLARVGSEFWLVQPEIGFSGVRGLDTLLSGVRLQVRPGDGAPARRFTALAKPPSREGRESGRNFILRSDKLSGMNAGAPIFYREVKVGMIREHRLTDDATGVLIKVDVFAPYDRLVRPQSRFWNAGGVAMKVGLLGAEIRSSSLEALVSGGIAFATPDEAAATEPAASGTEFALHEDHEKSWLKWAPRISLTDGALPPPATTAVSNPAPVEAKTDHDADQL